MNACRHHALLLSGNCRALLSGAYRARLQAGCRAPLFSLARWPCAVLLSAAMAGCATAPAPQLIVLPAVAAQDAAAPPVSGLAGRLLLVRRLAIPEYMVSRRVRYRAGTATLGEWPDAYWAERIEVGMAREFVAALRQRLPGWSVCDGDCGGASAELTVTVELLRLDVIRQDQQLAANARVQLLAAAHGPGPARTVSAWDGRFVLPLPIDSAQGEARALGDLLIALAEASARVLERSPLATPAAAKP